MDILILAAGRGKRLSPYTDFIPKPFMKINGEPIICRLLAQIKQYQNYFDGITIVTGYMRDYFKELSNFKGLKVELVYNQEWESKNNAFSFIKGIKSTPKDILMVEGDIVLSNKALKKIFENIDYAQNILYSDYFRGYTGSKFITDKNNKLRSIIIEKNTEKELNIFHQKSIGVMKLSKPLVEKVVFNINNAGDDKNNWYIDNFIAELIDDLDIYTYNIHPEKWIEIDTEEDYIKAKELMRGE